MNVRSLLVGAFALAGLVGSSIAAPIYQVIDLGFSAVAINERGQVVGNNSTGAVVWDPVAGITQIGPGVASDINNFGRVVGSDGSTGWIWDPVFGRVEPTGLVNPAAINDRGQIAGGGAWANPIDQSVIAGYLWDPTFGYRVIESPGSFFVRPLDLNNNGAVVGWDARAGSASVYWSPELEQARLLVSVDGVHRNGGARAINDAGEIVGNAECTWPNTPGCNGPYYSLAHLWTSSSAQPQRLGDADNALGINNLGWVVGVDYSGSEDAAAFLWSDSFGLLDLNTLVSESDPFFGQVKFHMGTDINDQGQILVDGRFLLNRVPEPNSLLLAGLGFVGLMVRCPRLS